MVGFKESLVVVRCVDPTRPGVGIALKDLWGRQKEWSEVTFGLDKDRGPGGALRHLALEAKEAEESLVGGRGSEDTVEELADCLLLLLDASRQAGVSVEDLVRAAVAKHVVNVNRDWPEPVDSDSPVEHIREVQLSGGP